MANIDPVRTQQAVMAELFESSFIEIVLNLTQNNKFKKAEFARQIWPESSPQVARNRWNGMRNGDSRTGKPISCTLRDAYMMASILGLQMAYVTLQAENMAEQRFKEMTKADDQQITPPAPRRRRKKDEPAGQSN